MEVVEIEMHDLLTDLFSDHSESSQVLEKDIFALINSYLQEHCPLADCQWGFRTDQSAVIPLLSTVNDRLRNLSVSKIQ